MGVTEEMRDLIVEIITDTEALENLSVSVNPVTRAVTIVYDDMGDDWFREVAQLAPAGRRSIIDVSDQMPPEVSPEYPAVPLPRGD